MSNKKHVSGLQRARAAALATQKKKPLPSSDEVLPPVGQPLNERSPGDDGISAIPIGGAVPPSAEMPPAIPPKFPLDLQAQLQAAADSGRYMIAVWTADEKGTITLFRNTAGSFLYDWWLRALSMLRNQIVDASPPGPAASPTMADDSSQNNPAADE